MAQPPQHHDDDDEESDDPFVPPASSIMHLPLNPQHFHTFVAVVDAGGKLSAAAREIGLSQPGVSHQLNELERRLNVQLLERTRGRAARLTSAGRVFERYARSMVQMQGALYADLEQMSRRVGGHMRVGASSGPGEHWLPPLLLEFREQFPDLHFELHVGDARSVVEQVFENDIELGFVGGRWSRSGLEFESIWRDEYVLIAAPGHPLAQRKRPVRLDDLAGVDFIAHEPGTGLRASLEQELGDRGLGLDMFNVLAELGNQESVKSAVAAGYGLGYVWRGSIGAESKTGDLKVIDVENFDPSSSYHAVRRANRRLSRRGRLLLEFLRRARDEQEAQRRRSASA